MVIKSKKIIALIMAVVLISGSTIATLVGVLAQKEDAPQASDMDFDANQSMDFNFTVMGDDIATLDAPITPLTLEADDTITSVGSPSPATYTVNPGTLIPGIGLPATLSVVVTDSSSNTRTEELSVSWSGTYNADTEGVYTLTASFVDASAVYSGTMPTVTVTVKKNADVLSRLASLPSLEEAAAMDESDKQDLRAKLINIRSTLEALSSDERTAVETEAGTATMQLYNDLYSLYGAVEGGAKDTLDDDWVYIKKLELQEVKDGAGPFDVSNDTNAIDYKYRDGNDENSSNGIIRTFDTATYKLAYQTGMSGEYDNVAAGYMCYEFVLPYTSDKAILDTDNMTWMGIQYESLSQIPATTSGYVSSVGTRNINGVDKECQIITGKRWMTGTDTNPYAFPGNGSVNAVVQILAMKKGDTVQPKFTMWMDHNITTGTCPDHERNEPKSIIPDPIQVTSELRLNVQLKQASNVTCDGVDIFNYNTGNDLAINKTAGNVYGRIICYSVTLQMYNSDKNKGLRGCAFPEGDIDFDVTFSSSFRKDSDTKHPVPLDGYSEYTPLVWSCSGNNYIMPQDDEREVSKYSLGYARYAAPYNGNHTTYTPYSEKGSNSCWNGGTWSASQSGATVSLKTKDYIINPQWYPNAVAGYSGEGNNTYFTLANGIRSTYIGCFSAAELYVVVPFGGNGDTEDEDYLVNKFGAGTEQLTVKDVKLNATADNGEELAAAIDNTNQQVLTDDSLTSTVYLSRAGTVTNFIQYRGGVNTSCDTSNSSYAALYNGQDVIYYGQPISARLGGTLNPLGEKLNTLCGLNSLMKYDDTAMEFAGKCSVNQVDDFLDKNSTRSYLYAAKPDGTGWRGAKNEDGTYALTVAEGDEAMNKAVEGDLIYYSTLAELKADGKICVGIMMEYRCNDAMIKATYAISLVKGTMLEDKKTINNAYQICVSNTYWTQNDYNKGKAAATIPEGETYQIPSRIDVQNGTETMPNAQFTNVRKDYVKAKYDSTGTYIGGHVGSNSVGDSVYVITHKCGITKKVEQIIPNTDKPLSIYDMDFDQRTADYVLYPKTTLSSFIKGDIYTTVMIEDILPECLTYVSDSSYMGGTYVQNPKTGRQGTIVDGEKFDPMSVVINEDGTTTIKWVLENVKVGEALQPIHYSCSIGQKGALDDVVDGQELPNTVTICSTEDNRIKATGNGNIATASITVSKQYAASISKVSDSLFTEEGSDMGWTLYYGNNGANEIENAVTIDTMPSNGDSNGSSFNGSLAIKEWTLDMTTASNIKDWVCYYSEDEDAKNLIANDYIEAYGTEVALAAAMKAGSTVVNGKEITWSVATIQTDNSLANYGSITTLIGKSPTAVAMTGLMKSRETYKAHVLVNSSDPVNSPLHGRDKVVNTLSRLEDITTATGYVVYRTLEGVTWQDNDQDGQRIDSETMISGVKITLMTLKSGGDATKPSDYEPYLINGNPVTIETGKQMDLIQNTVTDYSTGRYKFTGLPEGTFGVLFEKGSFSMDGQTATVENFGSDYSDSDAIPTYDGTTLQSAFISSIIMPAKDKLGSYIYESKFNDLGIYRNYMSWGFTKVEGNKTDAPLKGAKFELYYCNATEEGHQHTTLDEDDSCWQLVTTVTSTETGAVNFDEISTGTYALVEIKAPKGYALPNGYWILDADTVTGNVQITTNGKPTAFFVDEDEYFLPNVVKSQLPISGGFGTMALTICGTFLILTAGFVYVVTRTKKKKEILETAILK